MLSYLEWLAAMPWGHLTTDTVRLRRAKALLEAEHHGLHKLKRRIYEYLAVLSLHAQHSAQQHRSRTSLPRCASPHWRRQWPTY